MSRRPYIHLAGDLSGWPLGTVPTPGMMRRLDQFSSELVNGNEGGTWSPTSPLVIGPHSYDEETYPTITVGDGSELSGDIETVAGNSQGNELFPTYTPGLVLQGGANPTFESNRSRTIVVGFTNFVEFDSNAATNCARMVLDERTLGCKAISTFNSARVVAVPLPIKAQHRGATISQVDFRVIVYGIHTALPSTMMRFRISRMTGATTDALHSAGGGYDAAGYLVDPAATVSDFMNSNQPRTLSYVPDQNNTNLDPDTSWFYLEARAHSTGFEANQGLWLTFVSATVHLTGISSLRE